MGDDFSNSGERQGRNPQRIETQEAETTEVQHQGPTSTKKKHRRFKRPDCLVTNLSHKHLTLAHRSVLNKGLKFVPTPRKDHTATTLKEYLLFERRLRLKYHFTRREDEENEDDDFFDTEDIPNQHPLYESSGWTPPTGQDPHLDVYCLLTQQKIIDNNVNPGRPRFNLTKAERIALKDLQDDDSIVIKPADKGGKIVIQDREKYEEECYRQLSNRNFYEETTIQKFNQIQEEIQQTVRFLSTRNLIEETASRKLYNPTARIPPFYTLPKLHKEGIPGRPIVSGIDSPTERISMYVDYNIKDYVNQAESYIKDTNHFLQIIQTIDTTEDDILVTFDVSSLYTNIPHDEGLIALKQTLSRHTEPQPWVITRLAELTLRNNIFQFDDKIYIQKQGTAMGTRMAPSYANIYMTYIETKMLNDYPLKPKLWVRFIDDIFSIWQHGLAELVKFHQYMNSYRESLTYTMEHSQRSLPFLDVRVLKDRFGNLQTTLYIKETDAQSYLQYSSNHPRSQKDSIPFSQFVRIRKICSEDEDFEAHSHRVFTIFKERSYDIDTMKLALDRVTRMHRDDLINGRLGTTEEDRIRLITNYNRQNPKLKEIIHTYDSHIKQTRRKTINPSDFQVTYSRAPNLRNLLVHSQHPHRKKEPGNQKCNKPCATCPLMENTTEITGINGKTYKIHGSFNCQSHHIVYCITCTICNQQYIRESSQTLNKRIRGHVSTINTRKDTPVAHHFNKQLHSTQTMKVTALDRATDKNERLRLEESWILLLQTRFPSGINARM